MKATGIVRRIDDLGRVVIPKEIRRTMRIREGDPLEIYTDREGGVIFKKYSQLGDVSDFAAQQFYRVLHGKFTGISSDNTFVTLLPAHGRIKWCLIDNNRSDFPVRKRLDKLTLCRQHGNPRSCRQCIISDK